MSTQFESTSAANGILEPRRGSKSLPGFSLPIQSSEFFSRTTSMDAMNVDKHEPLKSIPSMSVHGICPSDG